MLLRACFGSTRRHIHSGPDNLEELLQKHIVPNPSKQPDSQVDELRRLTTTRREALSLYRDIIRASRFFVWRNEQGVPWGQVLRASARREFEEARYEKDPEVIARLLVGGRDAVQAAIDKAVAKQQEVVNKGPRVDSV